MDTGLPCGSRGNTMSQARQRVHYSNHVATFHLQNNELDQALISLKCMEAEIAALPPAERQALLPVVASNLAFFYFRRGKHATALQYTQKAKAHERRAFGAVDFATLLRTAAVLSKMKHHSEALKLCRGAVTALQSAAANAEAADDSALPPSYHAHLAVAYHNYAAELARMQQMAEAAAAAKIADELVAHALPTKHLWARTIRTTLQKLRDMNLSTAFVRHSLRPGAFASADRNFVGASHAGSQNVSDETPLEGAVVERRELVASASLPAIRSQRGC